LNCRNAFAGVYLAADDGSQKRQPLSSEQIRLIQKRCYEMDDDVRWLVALISDTGMRLAEAAGLLVEDVKLDHRFPHISLKPHPSRLLKTKSSLSVFKQMGQMCSQAKRVFCSSFSC